MTHTALKHQIAVGMRRLREEADITRDEAASVIHNSVQTVGHIETGRSLPSGLQLEKLLAHYGVPELIPRYLDLRERAKAFVEWWTDLVGTVPAYRALFLGGESTAERIETWDPQQVPELAQTPEYARALLALTEPGCEDVEERLDLLAARQRAVLEDGSPEVWLLVGEPALRWSAGSDPVAKAQLKRLLELGSRVRVRVLPVDAARRVGRGGSFSLLTFPGSAAVYAETLAMGYYYDLPDVVARYREALDGLWAAALDVDDSQALIRRLAR
jgi:DNA-binding XRE family transcriptional regulator